MNCLERIGLTRSAVRLLLIAADIKVRNQHTDDNGLNYVQGDQRKVWERVRCAEPAFFALAMMEVPTATIAEIVGVSDECVLRRLRTVGLVKRGRPPRHSTPASPAGSRSSAPSASPARR